MSTPTRNALAIVEGLPTIVNERRRYLQVTIDELSEELGLGGGTISRIERGESYTDTTLVALLRWLAATEDNQRAKTRSKLGRPVGTTKAYQEGRKQL